MASVEFGLPYYNISMVASGSGYYTVEFVIGEDDGPENPSYTHDQLADIVRDALAALPGFTVTLTRHDDVGTNL